MLAPTSFFVVYGCHVCTLEAARVLQRFGHRVTIDTDANGNPVRDLDIRRTLPGPWRRDYGVGSNRPEMADGEFCPVPEEPWLWHLRTAL
jgi:hypothetical protein